jgi:hypothetical protein
LLVTRRKTDQRNASRSNDGSTLERSLAGEPVDGRLAGFCMLAHIAHRLGRRKEAIVQLGDARDTVRFERARPSVDAAITRAMLHPR